jgi:mannose-6-phosphate isomerase
MMRELHTDLALDAIDFNVYHDYKSEFAVKPNETTTVVESPYFHTSLIQLDRPVSKDYSELDSFVIYICAEGAFVIKTGETKTLVNLGEAVLVPASIKNVEIHPENSSTILEVYMLPKI